MKTADTPAMETMTIHQGRRGGRSSLARWLLLGLVALVGGASALVSGLAGLTDVTTPGGESVDLCGSPLTGFFLFWHHHSEVVLLGLAGVLVALASAALYAAARHSRWPVVAALVILTLGLSSVPWLIQAQRSNESMGCHSL